MATSKPKPFVFFFLAIVAVSVFMFVLEWRKRRVPTLVVSGNKGIASLFSVDGRLTAVYQDGRTCAWAWNVPDLKQVDFAVGSGRAIPLTGNRFAALGRVADRFVLSVYDLDQTRKLKDLAVGWENQDVHLRVSHDGTLPAIIRRNPERSGRVEYEFLTANLEAELLRPAVVRSFETSGQTLRDFAITAGDVLVAAGADSGRARLMALDMDSGQTLWDKTWEDAEELTTVAVSIDGKTVWAGDRAGALLAVNAEDGSRLYKRSLLMEGENRSVTNDYSVLNLAASPDGRLLGCTITPIAYVVDAETGAVLERFGGHKVVSKVVFSPDSRKLATADLRSDGVIYIHTLKGRSK